LLAAGLRVIDLSADYRLKDAQLYEKWYKHPHSDTQNLVHAVYGLPEIFARQIAEAKLIANPGCYATCAILPLSPLVKAGLIDPQDIIVNAASGISGAGRNPAPQHHFPERNEAFEAYAIGTHRHAPEMVEGIKAGSGKKVDITFVPHLVPMDRGILSTIYARPMGQATIGSALDAWHAAYSASPFVRIRTDVGPSTKFVINTNYIDMAIYEYNNRWIIISALDNMVKGAAGQAIENMNIAAGFPRAMGLN
jgi:N-acetyl-gamma-glutamyl-phosphate reductase